MLCENFIHDRIMPDMKGLKSSEKCGSFFHRLECKKDYFWICIHPEIKARTIPHARRDIELPVACISVFPFWPVPSFVSRKCCARCEKSYLSEEWEINHRSVRMPCEEECRCRDRLLRGLETSEEKLEAIGIMQEDHIEVIMHVIECVDVLIEDHISLFFWHFVKVLRESVDAMNAETLIVDKNLFGVSHLRQEMHLHLVLEPRACVAKISIIVVMIPDNSKVSKTLKTVKKFFCDLDEVLKGKSFLRAMSRDEIASVENYCRFWFCIREEHLNPVCSLCCDSVDTASDVWVSEEEQ